MESLESELEQARRLSIASLADAIESIGFECTRCGACCTTENCEQDSSDGAETPTPGPDADQHTATVFPDEIRRLQDGAPDANSEWRDVARPMPYGLEDGPDGPQGETFEWALQTDNCGDCVFYEAGTEVQRGSCTVHADRPLICRTYPFSVALGGTSQPMGDAVDREGIVRAHECEGLGRDITGGDAEDLAAALRERALRELEEAIDVRENYVPAETADGEVIVHDSEGTKRPDGSSVSDKGTR